MPKVTLKISKKYIPNNGETTIVVKGEKQICIINKEGKLYAINNLCPHKLTPLSNGTLENDEIICSLHLFRFNFLTGKCSIGDYDTEVYDIEVE